MKPRPSGFTLVELLFFATASLILITVGYELLSSGSIAGVTAHQGLSLQQGVRNLMENLVKDVRAAAYIGEPNATTQAPNQPAHRIVLWIFNDELDDTGMAKLGERLNLNDGPNGAGLTGGRNPWPFYLLDNPTRWHLPAAQVIYEWDEAEKTVTRSYQAGELLTEATEAGVPFVDQITFNAAGAGVSAPVVKLMSEHVEQFDAYPFGYNEAQMDDMTTFGIIQPTHALPDNVIGAGAGTSPVTPVMPGFGGGAGSGGVAGTGPRIARTAMLWVKVKARFDYLNPKYRDPEVFLATKIWSHAKLYEHVYFPYFSSVDDDLRF